MIYKHALVETDGPILIVTLNRPEVMNALDGDSHIELSAIFDDFAANPDLWVAIITGAGDRAFCAGNDLKATAEGRGPGAFDQGGFAGLTARFDLSKPVLAAVNGLAMGGGFETALACDIIVASDNAFFSLPEPLVGLAALAGGLLRLPRAIGEKRAMELVMTSRRLGAQEAKDIGLVSEVTPVGEALAAAKRIAETICKASPLSIRASKETVLRGADSVLSEAMSAQWRYPAMQGMLTSEDLQEGPLAFAQKRAPQWKGR
jgi:crotonobetainyl-CoA hydratase